MAYMKDSSGKRLDSFPVATLGGAAVPFMSKLATGRENATLLVVGDSTGDETNVQGRWPLKTAQWLAAQYPAYTVNFRMWNYTADNYDALGVGKSVVVQTGTGTGNAGGPFVIEIYNASASGTAPSYHYDTTRWFKVAPTSITPNLVIVNHGHNLGGAGGNQSNYEIHKLARSAHERWPLAGIMVTAQNPMTVGQADEANDRLRARAVQVLAANEGYGLVNVLQLFLKDPSYSTNLLSDGLHPNEAGSRLWADEVIRLLTTGKEPGVTPRNPNNGVDRLWVPANRFDSYTGSPVFALTNNNQMTWAFPNGAISGVITSVDLPAHWQSYDTYLLWAVAGASGFTASTRVSWRLFRQQQATGSSFPVNASPYPLPAWSDSGELLFNPNNGTAYQTVATRIAQQSSALNAPLGVRIQRTGNSVSDVVAENAYMLGVMFVRAATL